MCGDSSRTRTWELHRAACHDCKENRSVEKEREKKHWSYFFGIIFVLVFFGGQKICLAQDSAENFISLEFFGILSSLGVQEETKRRECKELAEVRERTKWRLLILLFDPSGNSQKTASGSSRNATNLIAEVTNTRVDLPPGAESRNELLGEVL